MSDPHMILTPEELAELTDRVQPAAQCRWLRLKGWVFEVGAKKRPKVDRRYYESRMGHNQDTQTGPEPDFKALYG